MIHPIHLTIVLFAINFVYGNYLNIVDLVPNRGYRLHWKLIDNNEGVQFKVYIIILYIEVGYLLNLAIE